MGSVDPAAVVFDERTWCNEGKGAREDDDRWSRGYGGRRWLKLISGDCVLQAV